ncbi:MAG: CoA-binding protein [Deltaproteobacteria bacterium]|nr:CoA-binding protein [Deltaproteobacteria bacterium]
MTDNLFEEMDRLFHPQNMAAVGAADRIGNMGISFLLGYQKCGFQGNLYAVNPKTKAKNFDTYDSVTDIPGPLDEVRVAVSAKFVPDVIRDCVKKGVRCVSIFTSGFRETGTDDGKAMESEIARIARKGGVRLIGPNCMGILCPESGMSIRADMPVMKDGSIGLISQSGGIAISLALACRERELGLSKVVSYGNESDLGAPEFLYYLARDPKTSVICLYIEGTGRAEDLVAALKDAAGKKPVIMVKGGMTDAGSRAATSHTGALTGASEIWNAIARQTGATLVADTEEMLDLAMLFTLKGSPPGKNLGIITISGGFGVIATDLVTKAGFDIPELAGQTQAALEKFIDVPGTSIQNPVDMAAKFFNYQAFPEIFPAFDRDPNIDAFLMICAVEYLTFLSSQADKFATFLVEAMIGAMDAMKKPTYVVLLHTISEDIRLKQERFFIEKGYPVFPTVQRCLTAMNRANRNGQS